MSQLTLDDYHINYLHYVPLKKLRNHITCIYFKNITNIFLNGVTSVTKEIEADHLHNKGH